LKNVELFLLTPFIVPGSKLWGIPALCYGFNLGAIFYFNQDFSGSGVVVGANLDFNKKSSLDFGS
jgi:hypothetical protein